MICFTIQTRLEIRDDSSFTGKAPLLTPGPEDMDAESLLNITSTRQHATLFSQAVDRRAIFLGIERKVKAWLYHGFDSGGVLLSNSGDVSDLVRWSASQLAVSQQSGHSNRSRNHGHPGPL